jgi:hypothetical protein
MASILSSVGGLFQSILGAATRFFSSLFQAEVNIVSNIQRIVANFQAAKKNIETEVTALKKFKFDPKWSSRVINVPIAIQSMKDLIDRITEDFSTRLQKFYDPIHSLSLIFKADQPTGTGQEPAALTKAAVKLDEIATMIAQLADATDQIKEYVDLFTTIRETIEGLDILFLQQGNSRKAVTEHARIRIGALHSGE